MAKRLREILKCSINRQQESFKRQPYAPSFKSRRPQIIRFPLTSQHTWNAFKRATFLTIFRLGFPLTQLQPISDFQTDRRWPARSAPSVNGRPPRRTGSCLGLRRLFRLTLTIARQIYLIGCPFWVSCDRSACPCC